MPVQTVIKLRRDTAASWESTNPVLASGEEGYETDTGFRKIGNGTSAWAALPYMATSRIAQTVKNTSGSPMAKGSVVYISGATGGDVSVSLADADTEATSSKTIGLLGEAIANDGFGEVVTEGLLSGVNTASATAGQSVWLSSTAGGFVFNAPPAKPAHSVYLGVVTRVHATEGEILVKVQNGYEVNELHDVNIGTLADNNLLAWDEASLMWKNQTAEQAGIPVKLVNGSFAGSNGTFNGVTVGSSVGIGSLAAYATSTVTESVLVGDNTGRQSSSGVIGSVAIGNGALTNVNDLGGGGLNVAVGKYSGRSLEGSLNTFVGSGSGDNVTGNLNVMLGNDAGKNHVGSNKLFIANNDTATPLIYGEFDNAIVDINGTLKVNGIELSPTPEATPLVSGKLKGNTDGTIGYQTVALGDGAAGSSTGNMDSTVAIGQDAMGASLWGNYTVAVGHGAMATGEPGGESVAIGYDALSKDSSSGNNVAVGAGAMYNFTTGAENTAVGHQALNDVVTGSQNVALGTNSGGTGSGNVFLGYAAGSGSTASNKLYIANSNTATPLIYGEFDNAKVSVNGSLKFIEAPREKFYTDTTAMASGVGYNFDVKTNGSLQYLSTASTGNGSLNVRASSTVTLNSWLAVGESVTINWLITNGATAYYPALWRVDFNTLPMKWLGGTAPSSGNANAVDSYSITIVKTADATFMGFGAVSKFA